MTAKDFVKQRTEYYLDLGYAEDKIHGLIVEDATSYESLQEETDDC